MTRRTPTQTRLDSVVGGTTPLTRPVSNERRAC
jgi:hypothetical protein